MSDIFHKAYRPLSDEEKASMSDIKDKAEELFSLFDKAPQGREVALAKTNLEQAVMWAIKAITA